MAFKDLRDFVARLEKEGELKRFTEEVHWNLEAGAITQNPVGIGYKTVEAAVKALKGEKLPKIIDTGFYWYDKTNINDPKIQALLYK